MTTPAEAPLEAPVIPYVDPQRRARSKSRARRDALIASLSTVVVFALLAYLITASPGWPKVQETFFNLDEAIAAWPTLIRAFVLNIKIFLVAEFFILILSLLIALGRGLRAPVALPIRIMCTVYVDFFRGVPTILVILLLGFGVPALQLQGVTNSPVVWGTVALILSYTAYVAEVYRAGIESIHPSQRAAARSLGLSSVQTTRYVVLPQAVRRVIPPLLNDFIALQKETALVSLLGPIEVLRSAQINASANFNYTAYVVAALLFVAITLPLTRLTDWLQRRDTRRRMAGAM
ncbi:MAG: amino acid ABC transporter permease [Candidatus Nanopelagicales bacterium]|jgi:polar amino acid transport system permease protein